MVSISLSTMFRVRINLIRGFARRSRFPGFSAHRRFLAFPVRHHVGMKRLDWHGVIERFKFKYGPRAAKQVLSLSTYLARSRLRRSAPLSILVDNTVFFHAVTHETAWVSTGKSKRCPHEIETGYAARIPVRPNDSTSREYRNIRYLAGIAHLARLGWLDLRTSGELEVEQLRQPVGRFRGYGYYDHNLFADIQMERVDDLPSMTFGPRWMNLPSLEEEQRERLARSRDPLYLDLVRLLGAKNSQDAWHIRTAEAHGMYCFLTMDFKLCKNIEERRNQEPVRSLRTRVMTPLQLGQRLWLLPVNPRLLSYNDASYPVRADLHWPEAKRRRPKRTRSN